MKTKANIAIFVPHAGCPGQCSFCDQRSISGKQEVPTPWQITEDLTKAVAGLKENSVAEIAFFGGSFTAIDRTAMLGLLKAALPFVDGRRVTGIRVSTRPDAIDREVLEVLKAHRVTAVELGAQSMDDRVLTLNRRGHTAAQVEKAATLIREMGFSLGLQMMTGLYGANEHSDRATADAIIALRPDTVRIYPTLTLKGTLLERLYLAGEYTPPSLAETVTLCAQLLERFEAAGIQVIKLGLHAGAEKNTLAGPFHPALRELCEGEIYFLKARALLPSSGGTATLYVHPTCLSKMLGQRRCNLKRLAGMGWEISVKGDPALLPGEIQKGEIRCS